MSNLLSQIAGGNKGERPDPIGSFQQGFGLGQQIQQAPFKQKTLEANTRDAQLTAASNKLAAVGNLLNGVKDQPSYSMAKQQLEQYGIVKPGDIPDQYDPNFVQMHKDSLLNAKAQLEKQFKMAEIDQMKAGGATGTLLNRLQNDPALMDAYLGKANANKGLVIQNGQAGMLPGYNTSVASTEGAKKSAEQQAILNTAGDIEKEKTIGAATGKTEGEIGKRAINAPNNLMLITPIYYTKYFSATLLKIF